MVDFLGSILRRPPVGWWDLVDIAIVSFLIYEFLKLIRGTRAVQMGVGTLFIVALFYTSRLAPLQARFPANGDLWFFTDTDSAKAEEIAKDPRVNVSYAGPDSQRSRSTKTAPGR